MFDEKLEQVAKSGSTSQSTKTKKLAERDNVYVQVRANLANELMDFVKDKQQKFDGLSQKDIIDTIVEESKLESVISEFAESVNEILEDII